MKVIIVGAGLGGLTAALALLKKGVDVTVFEQAGELKEIGAGIQLSANATRVLFQLGIGDKLQELASQPLGKNIRLWNTGQSWPLFDLGQASRIQYGYPYFTLHRADLHRLLCEEVNRLAPGAIKLNQKVIGVDQSADGAVVNLENGSTHEATVVVGADGVHSRIRAALFGQDQPVFSGILAWRGVIKAADLPPHLRQPYGTNWVGPGAHVIQYPLRNDELINFVGVVERDGWEVESWSTKGITQDCVNDFAGWHEDVHTLIRAIETPYKWALMVREPMDVWSSGNVTLLGDACHASLPFLAQGAAMAIEDGYVLARCLEKYAATPAAALARYEDCRKERTASVVRGSSANTKRFHNKELASAQGASAYVSREWTEERVKERYEWLFKYDVDAVEI